ncbi:hypothetical protein [Ferrimicrobium acidiphilum]|jgi:hypothetical protein|uniref:hypothetical protein n=1 Tax=Ferrimicrobium acidiphilum TaxID=121039 RepID=UPI0023F529E4|nr:hypothetical protein [Ferrimicrobium acidiphilum]
MNYHLRLEAPMVDHVMCSVESCFNDSRWFLGGFAPPLYLCETHARHLDELRIPKFYSKHVDHDEWQVFNENDEPVTVPLTHAEARNVARALSKPAVD